MENHVTSATAKAKQAKSIFLICSDFLMIKLPLQRYGIPTTGAILISNHSQTMNIVSTLNEKLLRQNFDDEHSEALLWEECRQTALAYVRTETHWPC